MATTVVNVETSPFDVYIGRWGEGYFGNPFKEGSRVQKLQRFAIYFYDRIVADRHYKDAVEALRGKRLGCHCKPLACHGDIIAAYLDRPETP